MANYLDVKRKHFRFPAYDDTDGVKLQSEHRPAFSKADDWILTEIKDPVSHSHKEENQSLQRKVQSSQRDRGAQCSSKRRACQSPCQLASVRKTSSERADANRKNQFFWQRGQPFFLSSDQ